MKIFFTIIIIIQSSFVYASMIHPIITFKLNSIDTIACDSGLNSIRSQINLLAETLNDNPTITIKIIARAENSENYPKELSLMRAEFIKNILRKDYGIDPKRITAEGEIILNTLCNEKNGSEEIEKCSCNQRSAVFKLTGRNYVAPQTNLTIIQGDTLIKILENIEKITLKSQPFVLKFVTENCDAVYLNASLDSSSYLLCKKQKYLSLTCFNSPQTFCEYSKNSTHDIMVVKETNRGYHCLYAQSVDDEFIRLDSVEIINNKSWVGFRTVDQLHFLDSPNFHTWNDVIGKTIYLTYSPELEKYGKGVEIKFE